jgi:hypothetical protein
VGEYLGHVLEEGELVLLLLERGLVGDRLVVELLPTAQRLPQT